MQCSTHGVTLHLAGTSACHRCVESVGSGALKEMRAMVSAAAEVSCLAASANASASARLKRELTP